MTPEMLLPFLMSRDSADAASRDDDDADDDDREDDDREDDDADDNADDDTLEALYERKVRRRGGRYKGRAPRPYQAPSGRAGRATVQTGQGEVPVELDNVVSADEFRNVTEAIRKDIADTRTAVSKVEQRTIQAEAQIEKQLKKETKKIGRRLARSEKENVKLKKEVEDMRMMSMMMMLMQKPPQITKIEDASINVTEGTITPRQDNSFTTTYQTDSMSTLLPLMMMGGGGSDNGMMVAFMLMAMNK